MKKKRSLFLWILLFIFLTTYNFDFSTNIKKSIFPVNHVELSGISNSNKEEIEKKLDGLKGQSIFLINTKKLKETFEDFNFIKEIKIKKIYPNKIKVEIKEYIPIGIFIDNSNNKLLLEDGKVIKNYQEKVKNSLPLVSGKGAYKSFYLLHASLEELGFNKELIKEYNYFNINRWDIVLKNDKIIKLPVKGYEESLKKFLLIYKKESFNNFKIFDFRINEQLILK